LERIVKVIPDAALFNETGFVEIGASFDIAEHPHRIRRIGCVSHMALDPVEIILIKERPKNRIVAA
jgi:hypothetical protein